MLVAAANPCPCGRGEADPDCTCAPLDVQRYQGRLSGALADRIDILAAVRQPSAAEIGGAPGEPSAAVRERVGAARERQERRLGPGRCNAEMTPAEARECALADDAAALLADALRAAAAQRPRPRPGAAAGADGRRPRRRRGDRRASRWRRRCSCGGGTVSERARRLPRLPAPLAGCWPSSRPYIEKIATGAPGSRSPELLRLSNEDLVAVAAPQVAGAAARTGRGGRRRAGCAPSCAAAECWACCRHDRALPGRPATTPPTPPGR